MTSVNLLDETVQEKTGTESVLSQKTERPAGLPEKFWHKEEGAVRVETLVKSYLELERRLARVLAETKQPAEPDRNTVLKNLGRPDTADGYQICCDHGYFKPDPELNKTLHDLGFTQEQAQAVYTLAAEKLVPMMLDLAADQGAEREIKYLHDTFGGPEKWTRVARQLLAFGQKNVPSSLLSQMASSADGVITLYALMQAKNGGGDRLGQVRAVDDQGLAQIQKLMRDPKYWRDHDPKTMAKVREGFDRIYGEG